MVIAVLDLFGDPDVLPHRPPSTEIEHVVEKP
jgi:hypothetical protein